MGDAGIPALDSAQALPQSSIYTLLASVRDQGGERFDTAGWHYLETLARRTAAHNGSVRHMLEAKLAQALAVFAERFAHARTAAAEVLAAACEKHPQAATELQRLFAGGDFKGLRYFLAALEAREQFTALTALVAQLEPALTGAPGHTPVLHATSHATETGTTLELKTVRESRATWAKLSVDKQLALAMKQAPQNAGPINSHMLVLRSLAMMQKISPDYLSRIISYVDTLLLLDPGEMDVPAKRKKAVPARTAKPKKAVKK
jgi:hypothetical protein